jgi:hypothetical protein
VNYGVGESELGGISRVLREHEAMISVEEDLEFVPGTYAFLCAALSRYRDEPRVMGVTAWNHPRVTPPRVRGPYFTGRMSGLMWGTWRRAWEGVTDQGSPELLAQGRARGIDVTRFGQDLADDAPHELAHGMWDHRFGLHMLLKGGLFLFPARSMTNHIGYDPRATNSPNAQGWEVTPEPAPDPTSVAWPAEIREEPGSAELWRAAQAAPQPSLGRRLRRQVRKAVRHLFAGDDDA